MLEEFLNQRRVENEKAVRDLQEAIRKDKMSASLTRVWIKKLIPDMSNQEAIQNYIKASHESRAAKAAAITSALGGLKITDIQKLDPRAQIDKAFQRKNGRGGQRPVR